MNLRFRLSPEETRTRIMDVAEEHFRRIGYAKTAVADIAGALSMSPANVYRFFASKSAINEAICHRLMAESDALMEAILAEPTPAEERLRKLIITLHRFNKSRYTTDRRIHDMVEVAMQENWQAIEAHLGRMVDAFAALVSQGMSEGRFRTLDPGEAALTIKSACACLLHPMMIAEGVCHGVDQEGQVEKLADFIIHALRA